MVFGRRGATAAPAPAFTTYRPEIAPETAAPEEDRAFGRIPWATLAILLLIAAAFALELTDSPGARASAISAQAQLHLGAVSRDLVFKDGQVWRLLTAPWLHAGTSHIVGKAIALGVIGLLLEPIIGWRWLSAVYALGGLAGSLGSVALNERSVMSVGASGAIMAVMACAAIVAMHPSSAGRRGYIWRMCLLSGVPALLPSSTGSHIDYSDHLGGAVLGFLAGWVLLVTWNGSRLRPPFQRFAGAAAIVVGLAGLGALGVAAALPPARIANHSAAGLIPLDQMPASAAEGVQRANDYLADYPDDPRSHVFMAMAWAKRGGPSEAEAELQKALASPLLQSPDLPPQTASAVRLELIVLQVRQREIAAARTTAEPLCPRFDTLEPNVRVLLQRLRACG